MVGRFSIAGNRPQPRSCLVDGALDVLDLQVVSDRICRGDPLWDISPLSADARLSMGAAWPPAAGRVDERNRFNQSTAD